MFITNPYADLSVCSIIAAKSTYLIVHRRSDQLMTMLIINVRRRYELLWQWELIEQFTLS